MEGVKMPNAPDLIELINTAPESSLPPDVRPPLKWLFSSLDELLFLDNSSELAVDREVLIRILSDTDLTPPKLRDVMLAETAKYLGQRIKSFGNGQHIRWRDGEKYGLPMQPPSLEELRSIGLDPAGSADRLEEAIKAQIPDLPEFWMESDSKVLYDRIAANLLVNQTVWSCLVANLGFWAALNVIGTSLIALLMLGHGVPWQVVLKWIIIFTGVNTAYFILQCIVNPRYRA
jgi:hypothetical protein